MSIKRPRFWMHSERSAPSVRSCSGTGSAAFGEKLGQPTARLFWCDGFRGFLNCRGWWLSARKHVEI